MTDSHKIDLAKTVREVEQHLKIAPDRILAYYDSEADAPAEITESGARRLSDIDQSPAQLIVEDAAKIIDYELTLRDIESIVELNGLEASTRVHHILFGVGAELLIHAYCLDNDPLGFIERLRDKDTPSIDDGRQKLCSDLSPHLRDSQMRRLNLVLKLLHAQRNNAVHTGFHGQSHYAHVPPIYEVLQFLFNYISETPPEVVPKLEEATTRIRESELSSAEPVEFPTVQDK